MTKRPTRSDKYQYLLLECSCPHEILATYSNQESIEHALNPFKYDEKVEELMEELRIEFWKVADTQLTQMQKTVLRMRADGYTQMEIAEYLDVNQSSITKCLNGNFDYKTLDKDGKPKVFGGVVKKLKKLLGKNEKVKQILAELNELREEKW